LWFDLREELNLIEQESRNILGENRGEKKCRKKERKIWPLPLSTWGRGTIDIEKRRG